MRTLLARCFMVSLCYGVASTNAAESSTNKPPPAATNAPSLTLVTALRTNVSGTHKFTPAWTGACVVTVNKGLFTNAEPAAFSTNRSTLRFDAVVIAPNKPVGNVGPRAVARIDKDGGYTALHTLRERLPADSDIRAAAAKGAAALERLLGSVQGFPYATGLGAEPHLRLEWSLALLRDDTIETLQVRAVAIRGSLKSVPLEALEVRRGKASPEVKSSKSS